MCHAKRFQHHPDYFYIGINARSTKDFSASLELNSGCLGRCGVSEYHRSRIAQPLHAIDSLPQPFRVYFRPLLDVYRAAGPCNWPPLANVRASPGACSARNLLQIRSPDYECPPATLAGSPASTDGLRGVVYGPEMRTRATTPPQWNVARPATECGDRGMVTWLPANGASAMLAALAPDAHPTAEWVLDAPVPPPVYSGPEIPTLD